MSPDSCFQPYFYRTMLGSDRWKAHEKSVKVLWIFPNWKPEEYRWTLAFWVKSRLSFYNAFVFSFQEWKTASENGTGHSEKQETLHQRRLPEWQRSIQMQRAQRRRKRRKQRKFRHENSGIVSASNQNGAGRSTCQRRGRREIRLLFRKFRRNSVDFQRCHSGGKQYKVINSCFLKK